MKVSVLGSAGGIGQPLSAFLKHQLPRHSELALFDISPVAAGVAMDVSHNPTSVKVITATSVEEAVSGASVILIPAGVPRRSKDEDRSDLFKVNAKIIKELSHSIGTHAKDALVGVITNPVNSMVPIVAETLKKLGVYDWRRVFGITTLDVFRSRVFLAEHVRGSIDPEDLSVSVVGGHSGKTILPLFSQVSGLDLTEADLSRLISKVQDAGTEVVAAKANNGSATLSMASAAAKFCLSLVRALEGEAGLVECAYIEDNKYGTKYFASPLMLSKRGVEEILPLGPLNKLEQNAIDSMIPILLKDVAEGEEFIKS